MKLLFSSSGLGRIMRTARLALATLACSCVATGAAVSQESYPSKPIKMIVAFSPGGGTDLMARTMARYLQEDLGQPVTVENRPGGNAMLAHTYFLQQPDDGHTLLVTVPMPYMAANKLVQGAGFEVDDFRFINLPRQDYVLMATLPGSEFESAKDVVDYIRESPGELTIGVNTPGSADYINLMLFMRNLDIKEEDVRIVNYSGGNPVRLALFNGDVDVILVGGLTSRPAAEQLKPLMVFRKERTQDWDAPAFSEAMAELGAEGSFVSGALGGFAVHASFAKENPQAWQGLVDSFKKITNDPAKIEAMQAQQIPTEWIGPEASGELIADTYSVLEQHQDLIEGN
jgi:putative tricarboxylic transport membrane protein